MRQAPRGNGAQTIEVGDALDPDPYVYIDTFHFSAVGIAGWPGSWPRGSRKFFISSASVPSETETR